jgi:hypothetical protein
MKKILASGALAIAAVTGAAGAAHAVTTSGYINDPTTVARDSSLYVKNNPTAAAVGNTDIARVDYGTAPDPTRVVFKFRFRDLDGTHFNRPNFSLLDYKTDAKAAHYYLSFSNVDRVYTLNHYNADGTFSYNLCKDQQRRGWEDRTIIDQKTGRDVGNYMWVSFPKSCFIKGAVWTAPFASSYWFRDSRDPNSQYVSDYAKAASPINFVPNP